MAVRFGTDDDNEINFNFRVDSCIGLNIANLRVHKWASNTYLHIEHSWTEYSDKDRFGLLGLKILWTELDFSDNGVCPVQ